MPTRRTFLQIGAGGLVASALPFRGLLPLAAAAPSPSLPPHRDREPAGTRIEAVGGTGVLYQYGQVVPALDGWTRRESGRGYLSLDGDWAFRFDPQEEGLARGWHKPGTSLAGWDTIAVPSAWDLKDTPGFGGYDGSAFGTGTAFTDGYAWYRTKVRIPGDWSQRRVNLAFLAVNYWADVWVNGKYVGAHEGGHTPFAMPLMRGISHGEEAVIAVRVHRRASFTDYQTGSGPVNDPLALPWKPVDQWPYAGITRSAWIEAVPEVTISKVLVSAQDEMLDARVVVANYSDKAFDGHVVVDPGGTGVQRVRIPPLDGLFSPRHPGGLKAGSASTTENSPCRPWPSNPPEESATRGTTGVSRWPRGLAARVSASKKGSPLMRTRASLATSWRAERSLHAC